MYQWMDLQLGWDRLQALLAPEQNGISREQARKLGSILATRDWQLLHRCILLLMRECSEQAALSILHDPHAPSAASSRGADAKDERLLMRLIQSWLSYRSWLSYVCGTFTHHAGTACQTHLVCLLAAQRSNERIDQV
jgi:hypothetical protein